MKKLNLLNLEGAEVLTRQQLKMVMGGSGGGGTNTGISCSTKCKCPAGYMVRDGVSLPEIFIYPCDSCNTCAGEWVECDGQRTNCDFPSTDCIKMN